MLDKSIKSRGVNCTMTIKKLKYLSDGDENNTWRDIYNSITQTELESVEMDVCSLKPKIK